MKKGNQFWVGFSDLMTSLFFVMLVLYAVSFMLYKDEKLRLKNEIVESNKMRELLKAKSDSLRVNAEKYKLIELVEENLSHLKENEELFKYDNEHKRFNLSFDVAFKWARFKINHKDLKNIEDIQKLKRVGKELDKLIKKLIKQKKENAELEDVSYLVVVSGSASDDKRTEELKNYLYSYKRAFYLNKFWKKNGIDLDKKEYHHIIDFHIAGNGIGGIGRYSGSQVEEAKNQRFTINIIPKIGEIK